MPRFLLTCLLLIMPPASANSVDIHPHRCLVMYNLDGPAYTGFALQIENMRKQLIRQKIALVDLRHWQSTPPHIKMSGRERRLLRQQYDLQDNVSQALLLQHRQPNPMYFKGTVDLIDFLLACK